MCGILYGFFAVLMAPERWGGYVGSRVPQNPPALPTTLGLAPATHRKPQICVIDGKTTELQEALSEAAPALPHLHVLLLLGAKIYPVKTSCAS